MSIKDIFKLIKIYKEVKKIMSKAKEKPGIKTSELVVTIATIVSSIWLAIAGMVPAELMVKIVLISSSIYTVCRTIVKLTPSKLDDELLDKIAEKFRK